MDEVGRLHTMTGVLFALAIVAGSVLSNFGGTLLGIAHTRLQLLTTASESEALSRRRSQR